MNRFVVAKAIISFTSAVGISTLALMLGVISGLLTKAELVEPQQVWSTEMILLVSSGVIFALSSLVHWILVSLEERAARLIRDA